MAAPSRLPTPSLPIGVAWVSTWTMPTSEPSTVVTVPVHPGACGYCARIAAHVDALSFCFSKGLGCPVGSVLIGERTFVAEARRVRKQLGGGMRQAGVLAAAALHALDRHVERLAEDHANARLLAEGLDGLAGIRVRPVETNIVLLDTSTSRLGPMEVVGMLIGEGVRCLPMNATTVRLVTHLDVTRADVAHAVQVARKVLG